MEDALIKILISLALGALIGMERERRMKKSFAGFRTFMLVCLLGYISSYLSSILSPIIPIFSFLFIGMLAVANFIRKIIYKGGKGITTEVAFLLTFLIGVILYYEKYPYAISLTLSLLLTLILVLKESLHEFAHKVTSREIEDFIIFGLVAFVIYPMLPDHPIDPLGITKLRFIWRSIVAIFGLSFFVYSIFKTSKAKGIFWSSILGGLINSIYVSDFFSSNLKKKIVYPFIAATSSMLLRAYILSIIINPSLLIPNIFLLLAAISGYTLSYFNSRRGNRVYNINVKLTSPISFKFTAFYILLFSFLFFIANIITKQLGIFASQILAAVVGLIDVSSLATIFSTFNPEHARALLLILTCSNLIGNSLFILKNNKKLFLITFKYLSLLILLNIFFFLLL